MSWDAVLIDDRGHCEGAWDYTHNCNMMANIATEYIVGNETMAQASDRWWLSRNRQDVVDLNKASGNRYWSWWEYLDGLSGPDGAAYLDAVINKLQADPQRFRAMNPPNGWGDYDSFLSVLIDMRDRVPEWPTTWSCEG